VTEKQMPVVTDWWCKPGDRMVMVHDLTEYADPNTPLSWVDTTAVAVFNRGPGTTAVWTAPAPVVAFPSAGRLTITLLPAHTLPEAGRVVFYAVRVTRTTDGSIITNVAGRILIDAG